MTDLTTTDLTTTDLTTTDLPVSELPRRKHSAVMRALLPLAGRLVVDVGCGDGALVRFMTREGARAIGVEPSAGQLARARAAGPAGEEAYLGGQAQQLPFADTTFDALVLFNALHHVPVEAQAQALDEAGRVVGPGGLVYVMEPIAAGAYFELVRPVEDETVVRARAQEALREALRGPLYEAADEVLYEAPFRQPSFEAFKTGLVAVNEARRDRLEAMEEELRRSFESAGERRDGAVWFYQPSRLNLLRRRA